MDTVRTRLIVFCVYASKCVCVLVVCRHWVLSCGFCLPSSIAVDALEVGIWHQEMGFSPQEIEFDGGVTTNDNSRDDKIVAKITTKMGQHYNSFSVSGFLFSFVLLFFALITFSPPNDTHQTKTDGTKERAILIRQNSLLLPLFFVYCYFRKSPFASVYLLCVYRYYFLLCARHNNVDVYQDFTS